MKTRNLVSPLVTKTLEQQSRGRCLEQLFKPLSFRLAHGTRPLVSIVAPEGMTTDAATIPKILWSILPPDGPWKRAAVLHDWMYKVGVPRFLADAIFRHVMDATGVPCWQRIALYYGTRIGGWRAWRRYRKGENGVA